MKKLALFASVLMLGVLAASAGTLGVAQFNDAAVTCDPATLIPTTAGNATFITLKNNTASDKDFTVLYFSLLGVDRTPVGANTFSVGANSARVWRPVRTDASEGAGSGIPNATTGVVGVADSPGTASIVYSGAASEVSGRGLTTAGVVQIAYAWTLVP